MSATNTLLTLHDPALAKQYYASGVWQDQTFYALAAEHARKRPQAAAVRDATRRLSYAELVIWVDALASDLACAGVKRGQRVSIWLPNCVEALVVLLACSRNGYVCNTSLHQNYTAADVARLLRRMGTAALFAQPGFGADAGQVDVPAVLTQVESLRKTYWLDPGHGAGQLGQAQPSHGFSPLEPAAPAPAVDRNPDKVLYLAFTSGTTGEPKGVMHSDNTLLANARCMVDDWGFGEDLVLYSLSPLSHHIGTVAVAQVLYAGGELVVNDVPPGQSALDWIIESTAVYVMGVPTHAIDILSEQARRGLPDIGHVKVFYMAGSPIPPETAQAFLNQGITPQNIYGMTENSSHQYTLPTDDARTIVATCGRACAAYEVRIFDPETRERELRPSEVGEIGGRGGALMLGYFDNQTITEESFNAGGWFMSGDLGSLDERGCLTILGRQKDLIIRGGHNIYPSQIEALAIKHPRINKAAAIPMPDSRLGEKVCLAVLTEGDVSLDAMDVLAHLDAQGLSKYDMPEYFTCMREFPLTASGKILKRILADRARAGELTAEPVRWTGGASV